MYIDRIYSKEVKRLAKEYPAILLTGPRQVGKTTLLRHLFPKAQYVTFDSPALARAAEDAPESWLAQLTPPVILDEIQYVPHLFRYLKAVIDQGTGNGRYLLTGSQQFPLMQHISESLAGRCAILELPTLAFSEVTSAHEAYADIDYMVRGGFPKLHAEPTLTAADWYGSYVSTYLERDVRNIRQIGDLRDFERLLRAAAARTGQLLSYADLARDVGVSPNTAKEWISILVSSGQIVLLEPYHRSLGKRLAKSPKLYWMDTGLACHLVGIQTVDELQRSPLVGVLWENHVIGQWIRALRQSGTRWPLWFWRTHHQDEVDFVIERGGRLVGIECKWSELPTTDATKGLHAMREFYGKKVVPQGFVACRTSHPFRIGADIWALNGSLPQLALQRLVE